MLHEALYVCQLGKRNDGAQMIVVMNARELDLLWKHYTLVAPPVAVTHKQ